MCENKVNNSGSKICEWDAIVGCIAKNSVDKDVCVSINDDLTSCNNDQVCTWDSSNVGCFPTVTDEICGSKTLADCKSATDQCICNGSGC